MAVGYLRAPSLDRRGAISERVRRTVALLRRRGYALTPARLAEICLGGPVAEAEVRWAIAADSDLALAEGLVIQRVALPQAGAIRGRANGHAEASAEYVDMAVNFVRRLITLAPFITGVSIAGSLASGGFRSSDDVDLNLIVEDGHRHLAYVVVNFLGLLLALRHRAKPGDDLTRRPIAPRLMTANLILERSQGLPLVRQDEDMAFELLIGEPVFGVEAIRDVIDANPILLDHFPQLAQRSSPLLIDPPQRRVSKLLFPSVLDWPARLLGESAWRYMQWTRRNRPDALARVAFVRATMRPYTLFDTN